MVWKRRRRAKPISKARVAFIYRHHEVTLPHHRGKGRRDERGEEFFFDNTLDDPTHCNQISP